MAGMGMQMSAGMAMGGAHWGASLTVQQAPTQVHIRWPVRNVAAQIPQGSKLPLNVGHQRQKRRRNVLNMGKRKHEVLPGVRRVPTKNRFARNGAKTAAGARFCPRGPAFGLESGRTNEYI